MSHDIGDAVFHWQRRILTCLNMQQAVGWVGIEPDTGGKVGFIDTVVVLLIDLVTILLANLQQQIAIAPIAAQTIYLVSFCHQFFREKAGEMAYGTDECATKIIIGVTYVHLLVRNPIDDLIFRLINADLNTCFPNFHFPFILHFSTEIIECRELVQGFVPPVHHAIFLIHIFMGDFNMFAFVVNGIGADDDFGSLVADGRIASTLKVLVGNAAVVVKEFVVPFSSSKNQSVSTKNRLTVIFIRLSIHLEDRAAVVELIDESFGFHVIAFQRHAKAVIGSTTLFKEAIPYDGHVGVL